MKLTNKDKKFLERLKDLFEKKDLSVELKNDGTKRMILCKNYGDNVESAFGMTRQGVRYNQKLCLRD